MVAEYFTESPLRLDKYLLPMSDKEQAWITAFFLANPLVVEGGNHGLPRSRGSDEKVATPSAFALQLQGVKHLRLVGFRRKGEESNFYGIVTFIGITIVAKPLTPESLSQSFAIYGVSRIISLEFCIFPQGLEVRLRAIEQFFMGALCEFDRPLESPEQGRA